MTDAPNHDDGDRALIERIVGQYVEMPGLSLTIEQACRLWGFDAATCRRLTESLIRRGVLRWSRANQLVLAKLDRNRRCRSGKVLAWRTTMKSDLELRKDVLEELAIDPSIDAAQIAVTVKDGIVTLGGDVTSYVRYLALVEGAKRWLLRSIPRRAMRQTRATAGLRVGARPAGP